MKYLTSTAPLFVSIVECGSFTQAAEQLGVSKSYLSEQVKLLEKELASTLLHRTTRQLSLTDAGQVFYEQSKKLLEWRHDTQQRLAASGSDISGSLNITATQAFAERHLFQVTKHYLQHCPNVRVNIEANNRQSDLFSEGFDLAIRLTDNPPQHLIAKQILEVDYICCASPAYLDANGQAQTPAELTQHNCLTRPEVRAWEFTEQSQTISQTVRGNCTASSNLILRDAAITGLGIIRAPHYVVDQDIYSGKLLPILTAYQASPRPLYLLYSPQKFIPLKLKLYIEHLQKYLSTTSAKAE